MSADHRLSAALRALAAALGEFPSPGMIIGGIAVIAAGVPRETVDVDATVRGRDVDVDEALAIFARHDVVPRIPDAREFARERHVLLLVHAPSGVTIEVSFAWLPFEEEALSRARLIDLHGIPLRVARAEDLIIYKAAAWRDRDRSDIERLLVLHLDAIDLARVRGLIAEIAQVLEDPDRAQAFDRMVERARKS
ncbi:MAG TPA: DUF6036 family nucleotidyltransferase [Thermoanaerobaculia bacterium]|nr:DUF6036 family nucleotidyltransferase [Thermoanaerobaculia bacterium]